MSPSYRPVAPGPLWIPEAPGRVAGVSASVSSPPLLVSYWIWGSLSSPKPHHIHSYQCPFSKYSHIHSLRGHELGGGERGGDTIQATASVCS